MFATGFGDAATAATGAGAGTGTGAGAGAGAGAGGSEDEESLAVAIMACDVASLVGGRLIIAAFAISVASPPIWL